MSELYTRGRQDLGGPRARIEQLELALRGLEELLTAIRDANPDPMAVVRFTDQHVIDCNEAYLERLGKPREQVVGGRNETDREAWIDPDAHTRFVEELVNAGRSGPVEARLRDAEGREHNVRLTARAVHIDGALCHVWVSHDVTDRVELETEHARLGGELRQALDEVERLRRRKAPQEG